MDRDQDSTAITPDLERLQREKEEALDQLALRDAEIEALTADLRDATHLLTEARDRYADLYEFAPVGYVTFTAQGSILEANSTFISMLGLDPRTLHNAPFNVVLAAVEDIHLFLAHMRACREHGTRTTTELRLRHRDGTVLHVQLSSVPTADYASRAVVFRTAVVDVTERKEAEQHQNETRRQLQSIMDASPVPIGYLDTDQRFVFVNAEYLRKFHYREEEVLGHTFREVHGSDADDLLGDGLERAIAGETSAVESYVTCRHSGETFFLRVDIAPDCPPGGTLCGIVIVATDLTGQKRIHEELREAKDVADRANQAKSQFLANMSHELRAPMNGLLGMIQLALDGYTEPLEPKQREVLTKSYSAGKALLRILNDILDLSKVEAGTLSIEESPFSLRHCADEAVNIFADQARQKNVNLALAVADDVPDTLMGDSIRLRQVLINLISNAVKFTDRGAVEIDVTVGDRKQGEDTILFTVSDTGIGIPEDKKHLLFRPFSQVDPSHTRNFGGTGIGLSISERIVRMMGGKVSFTSTERAGSTFSFAIPFREAELPVCPAPAEPERIAEPGPAQEKKKARILVAEDDFLAADLLRNVLEIKGFDMELAQTGREAIAKWEQEKFDLIVMDVQMPKMDGLTATRIIREKEQTSGGHIPIVAMTGYANREEEEKCLAIGMDAFVPKPIDLRQGLDVIMSLLKNRTGS